MTNVADLHIEREILPLFDLTCNDFSKDQLSSLLREPLSSKEEILGRQEILKGYIANADVLDHYSYSRIDLFEVYTFSESYTNRDITQRDFQLKLLFSERERHLTKSKFIQAVLLLHKLHTFYVKRINVGFFPHRYKKELQALNDFLESFNLAYYADLIRDQRFKVKHILHLNNLFLTAVQSGEMKVFWKRYFLFEAYLSISKGMVRHRFCFPTFSDSTFILKEIYHPLLKQAVKNSFSARSNVLLLTGPNMSGKSTFLKSVGLCVYLAHIGIGVPAREVTLPFFDSISVSINLNDDMKNGYSHFMTEIMNLKRVVLEAASGKRCFAIFDELFRGTNIEDAVDISTTTVKGLTRFKGSFFFISTHLHQLRNLEEVRKGSLDTYYVDCDIINGIPKFSYVLQQGWSDLKVGRILFDKEGLEYLLTARVP